MKKLSGIKEFPQVRLTFYLTITGILCLLVVSGFQQQPNTPLGIGNRLELFVDDYLIESFVKTELRLQTPVDMGPVVYFDKPWEGPFSAYTTIINDGNIYRLYYRGRPQAGKDGTPDEVTCYAESSDGINWVKPDLKIHNVMGTLNNNIILKDVTPASHNFSPFLDTEVETLPTGGIRLWEVSAKD